MNSDHLCKQRCEAEELSAAFRTFDKDNCGRVTESNLRVLLRVMDYRIDDALLEKYLKTDTNIDIDRMITLNDFLNLISDLETEEKRDFEARAMFNAFDTRGKGFIPANEIKNAMMFILDKLTTEEKENVIQYYKLNPDRCVFFKEFKDMITLKHYDGKR